MRTAPKYQNEAVVHRLIASGRVGTTATLNKQSRDPTNTLEIVDKYKYLGLWCSNNKNIFVKNHSYLAEQARKAIFTIRNYSHNIGHLTPKLSLKYSKPK